MDTGLDLTGLVWRKARRSGENGGNCVEVAKLPDGQFAVRNSRFPDDSVLIYTGAEFAAFVGGVHDGDFDDMIS